MTLIWSPWRDVGQRVTLSRFLKSSTVVPGFRLKICSLSFLRRTEEIINLENAWMNAVRICWFVSFRLQHNWLCNFEYQHLMSLLSLADILGRKKSGRIRSSQTETSTNLTLFFHEQTSLTLSLFYSWHKRIGFSCGLVCCQRGVRYKACPLNVAYEKYTGDLCHVFAKNIWLYKMGG